MNFHYLFFALICTALSSAMASVSSGSSCDFSSVNAEDAIDKLIDKFPEYEIIGPEKYYPVFAGFEISGFNVSGFHKLHQYGPVMHYCRNGTRLVQVDFINTGVVLITTPWKHCSGYQGTFSLRSRLSRFTVQFHVGLSNEDGETKLSYHGSIIPVITENIQAEVDGAGRNVNVVAGVLAMMFPEVTKKMWNQQFYYPLSRVLYRVLS
nr:uncharacterized protein LOC119167435 isoform X1 [Rhipicephalus microplus]